MGNVSFEEIDKAHPTVLDRLFFMMDEGIVYDNNQKVYSARGAFIMMTTNAASNDIIIHKDDPNLRSIVNKSLQRSFRLSFLNRYDSILIFKPFTENEQLSLARVLVNGKVDFLSEKYGWNIRVSDEIYRYIAKKSENKLYGARPMERLIEYVINYSVAEFQIMYGRVARGSNLEFEVESLRQNLISLTIGGKTVEVEIDTDFNTGSFIETTPLELFN